MGLTLAQLRTELREHLGVGDEFATADCDLLINRSWWEVQKKFKFREKDASEDFSTIIGTNEYNLPTAFDTLDRIALIDNDDVYHQLLALSIDEAIQSSSNDEDDEDQPTHYQRRGDKIYLFPTPDDVYTVRVFYQETLADVISDGPPIPQEWHEIILYGAVHRGHARYGDINKSAAFSAMQAGMIASCIPVEVKEIEDSCYAQVQVLRPRYP